MDCAHVLPWWPGQVSTLRAGLRIAGKPWPKGTSGNPGGRPKISTAIKAAGFDPESLRKEVIEALVHGMRELDPGSKESGPSWRFCVDRLDVRLNGPVKEYVTVDDQQEMTDEEYKAALDEIAQDHLSALTPAEKERLLRQPAVTPGAGNETVQ